jgi:hypothetical protein
MTKQPNPQRLTPLPDNLSATASYIADLQLASGALPWFHGGITDPWDHVEAIMGLSIAGFQGAAEAGFQWLANMQRPDGGWFAAYQDEEVADGSRAETNFVAYVATGLWHNFLLNQNPDLLRRHWPMVHKAVDFVLSQQAPSGEIYWAVDSETGTSEDALVTGCSAIYKSLACACHIARTLGKDCEHWHQARTRLGLALLHKPERFDRTWESKARYSMDWFYPVLTGVITGTAATQRLDAKWDTFVEPGLGCRCVSDQPWVTVAETCELIMACVVAGRRQQALTLYQNIQRFQLEDGSWWTGYVFPDDACWPDEKPTWTAGAVLLAADALFDFTPAAKLFKTIEPLKGSSSLA